MAGEVYFTSYNDEPTNPVSDQLWENYGNVDLLPLDTAVTCQYSKTGNLAYDVLQSFGIECSTPGVGGELKDVDIKRMDARTLINLSLIEYSALEGSYFYEAIADEDGGVEFVGIGDPAGDSSFSGDIYYETQTGNFKDEAVAVMVIGGVPPAKRKPLTWKPIWGLNPARIYSMKDMFLNCHAENFSRYATIAFKDPHLDTGYNDGVDNMYDINDSNPWDRVVGWVKYKEPPKSLLTPYTDIKYSNQTQIPINIGGDAPYPDMGELQPLPTYNNKDIFDPACWSEAGAEVNVANGVIVEVPSDLRFETIRGTEIDRFIGITDVFLVGLDIDILMSIPNSDADAVDPQTPENSTLLAHVNTVRKTTRRLTEGREYAVGYDGPEEGPRTPYIVFVKDIRPNDNYSYGAETKFYFSPTCKYLETFPGEFGAEQTATIFPYSKTKGMIVNEIWVYAQLETPCIVIEDTSTVPGESVSNRALDIAQNLKYYISPIVVEEKPAPVGFCNGAARLIDQKPKYDHDPTTQQSLEDTEYELALDEMQGGGMTVTYSFLTDDSYETAEDMVVEMSQILYDHMNSDVVETTYTCGPNANPKLGRPGLDSGSVINSIVYSYSDQGSYTVSVTTGPKLIGNLAQVDGGPTEKMSEDLGATGTVIDSIGDGMTFKVRIDGFGDRWAISTTYEIIRIGDRVACSIHNCPIER